MAKRGKEPEVSLEKFQKFLEYLNKVQKIQYLRMATKVGMVKHNFMNLKQGRSPSKRDKVYQDLRYHFKDEARQYDTGNLDLPETPHEQLIRRIDILLKITREGRVEVLQLKKEIERLSNIIEK